MAKFSDMSNNEQDDYMDSLLTGIGESLDRIATAVEGFHVHDGSESTSDADLRFAVYEIESKASIGAPVDRRISIIDKVVKYIQDGTVSDASSGSD